MSVMSVTSTVIDNLSKHLMLHSTCKPVSNFVTACQSVKPARKLIDVNWKRPHEQLVINKNSRQHDFTKPFSAMNIILMMSIYFYELVLLFFIFHHNFCNNNVDNFFKGYVRCNNFSTNKFLTSNNVAIFNVSDKNVLSSSVHFYQFSFSFYENSFFTNSVFYIFNVNSVTNILNNDFYITYLFDRCNRFLFCNYKVTRECINIFHQRKNKSNMSKISITSDNNAFFLVIVLVIFRDFNRKRRDQLKLCYLAIFLIVILLLKFQIKDGFPLNFTSLQKCLTYEFLN